MDGESLSENDLFQNLDELEQINRFLGGNHAIWNVFKSKFNIDQNREFVIADLGCGGCDVSRMLVKQFRKMNKPVQIYAYDLHPLILKYANKKTQQYPEIRLVNQDVLSSDWVPEVKPDWIMLNLFLHHLNDTEIKKLLTVLLANCHKGIVISDLHRNRVAYMLFKFYTFVFRKSYVTVNDGLLSIKRSFRRNELKKLTEHLTGVDVTIKWKWAFRWIVIVEKHKKE